MPFPKLYRNTSNQATKRAKTLRKVDSKNLTLGDDRAHEIASGVQNTRIDRFEMDFKTLIKKLRNREKIVTQRLDKRNTPKSHRLTHLHRAH
jgi:benzoyl-CoA reductase/2-hydroxyglutaryl-CoA dehydratase subunit BcrC/BadD/HgdB